MIYIFKNEKFVKQFTFLFALTLLIIGLSACGSSKSTANNNDDFDSWVENVGKTSNEVFDNLDLEEGKDIKAHDHVPYFYFYEDEKADIHGESFQKMLAFDPGNDKLHHFGYWKSFDSTKDGYELVKKIYDDYDKKFTATDDKSESGRLYNMPDDYAEIEAIEDVYYGETWHFDEAFRLQLEFTTYEDDVALVKIEYSLKPEAAPDDW